eukprot:g1743.t1
MRPFKRHLLSESASDPQIERAYQILAEAEVPVEIPQARQGALARLSSANKALRALAGDAFHPYIRQLVDSCNRCSYATDTHKLYPAAKTAIESLLQKHPAYPDDDRKVTGTLLLVDVLDDRRLVSESISRQIPFGTRGGIAGHVAASKEIINMSIAELKDHPTNHLNENRADDALSPDEFWQSFAGDPTKEVICVPIVDEENGNLLGVLHAERDSPSVSRFRKATKAASKGRRRAPRRASSSSSSQSVDPRAKKAPFIHVEESAVVVLSRFVAAAIKQALTDAGDAAAEQMLRFRTMKTKRRCLKAFERNVRSRKRAFLHSKIELVKTLSEKLRETEAALSEESNVRRNLQNEKALLSADLTAIQEALRNAECSIELHVAQQKAQDTDAKRLQSQLKLLQGRVEELIHRGKEQQSDARSREKRLEEKIKSLERGLQSALSNSSHEKAARIIQRLQMQALGRALRGWHDKTKELKRQREGAQRILLRMKNRNLAKSFAVFVFIYEEAKRQKQLLRRAAQRMRQRHLTSAFNGFIDYRDCRRFLRTFLWKMVHRFEKKEIAAGFTTWRIWLNQSLLAEEEARIRALEQDAAAAAARRRGRCAIL